MIITKRMYEKALQIVQKYNQQKEAKNHKPSFWFMCDNHRFIKPKGKTLDDIISNLIKLGHNNHYGMICSVSIINKHDECVRTVGDSVHIGKGAFDISEWEKEVRNDPVVKHYFKL